MQVVSWPNLPITFNLALNEVLRAFYVLGGEFEIYGVDTIIHRCELHYNKDNILVVSDRPKIVFLGDKPIGVEGGNSRSPGKCEDGFGNRVRVTRDSMERTVHVIIPRGKVFPIPPYDAKPVVNEPGDKLMADQIWGSLIAVLHGNRDKFIERGIIGIKIDDFPQEKSDEQYIVNTGRLQADVEYTAPTGFSPTTLPPV